VKRTVLGIFLTFIFACAIVYFEKFYQSMGLPDVSDISALQTWLYSVAEKVIPLLIIPFTLFMNGDYIPIIAWGIAGFAGGAIAKSYSRAFLISLISVGLVILILMLLPTGLSAIYALGVASIEYDWGVAVAITLIAALIGSSLTMSEEE